jgi:ATP synthase protein I
MASPPTPPGSRPRPDPWHAFGYLVAGVAFYGLIGFGLDQWLGTSWLVAVGVVLGAVLGLYLTWKRIEVVDDHTAGTDGRQ